MKRLLVALLLVPSVSFAQSTEETVDDNGVRRAVKYRERDEVDFERGLELEGELMRPAVGLITDDRRPIFNPLIHLRENWKVEMLESVDTVR